MGTSAIPQIVNPPCADGQVALQDAATGATVTVTLRRFRHSALTFDLPGGAGVPACLSSAAGTAAPHADAETPKLRNSGPVAPTGSRLFRGLAARGPTLAQASFADWLSAIRAGCPLHPRTVGGAPPGAAGAATLPRNWASGIRHLRLSRLPESRITPFGLRTFHPPFGLLPTGWRPVPAITPAPAPCLPAYRRLQTGPLTISPVRRMQAAPCMPSQTGKAGKSWSTCRGD